VEELKETSYEQEAKISDLEIQLEEQKNKYEDELNVKGKELKKGKDGNDEISRKYEQLKKRYDEECNQLKGVHENEIKVNQDRLVELENTLKETKETFEMAKQNWTKEEAVLKQRLEFAQFQLEEEKKKFEENRVANESLLKSLQS
jgi:hypothetical protein